ncbi:hypothetical protein BsWGS_23276 [Bradybaena similaris]
MADTKDTQKMNYGKKTPLPVDRGWAWVIMFGNCVIMLIVVAFARSLSIFLPDILDRYNQPATVTTLAFGMSDLTWSLTNIIMPSLLLPRFSVRGLALTGAFAHCFGFIALAYSPNIVVFNCIFGVVGAAAGLMIAPAVIHLGHYFKKRLSFASSVTHIGGSTSTVLVPRLAQFLKDKYGYQGALLILGGISFHCVAAAMLLWPISMFDNSDHTTEEPDNSSMSDNKELLDNDGVQIKFKNRHQEYDDEAGKNEHSNDEEINEESKFLQGRELKTAQINGLNSTAPLKTSKLKDVVNEHLYLTENEKVKSAQIMPLSETRFTRATSQRIHNELQSLTSRFPDLALDLKVNSQSDNYTQSERSLSDYNGYVDSASRAAVRESTENYTKCAPTDACLRRSPSQENVCKLTVCIQDGFNHNQVGAPAVTSGRCCSVQKIKAYLSSSVLLNPVAMMLIVAGGLSTPGGNMYLPVLGLENGLSPDEVSWMLTIMGISDIIGKLFIGFFADLRFIRPIRIACIAELTVGMVCQFATFYKGFGPMAGMAVIFGMMNGVVQALMSTMVIELLGLPYLAQVTSIFFLSMGLFTFVLNVTVGAIRDATGSFIVGFNFLGGMMLTAVVILILEPVFVKCSKFSKHAKN